MTVTNMQIHTGTWRQNDIQQNATPNFIENIYTEDAFLLPS